MNQGMPAETERASKPLNQQDADQQSNGKKNLCSLAAKSMCLQFLTIFKFELIFLSEIRWILKNCVIRKGTQT
jgi:hypothetical protein